MELCLQIQFIFNKKEATFKLGQWSLETVDRCRGGKGPVI